MSDDDSTFATPDELAEEMEGHDLDAAVAEEVMGWRWRTWSREGYREANISYPDDASESVCVMVHPDMVHGNLMPVVDPEDGGYRQRFGPNPPHYSTDIAAAWEVVDEMVGAPDYAVAFNVSPWPDGGWLAGFCITDIEYAREQGLPIAQFSDEQLYARTMVSRGGESLEWDLFNGWGGIGAQAHGIDAPHAISRAALRAVRQ